MAGFIFYLLLGKLQGLYLLFFMAQAFALTIQSTDFYAISVMGFLLFIGIIYMKNKEIYVLLNFTPAKICNCRSSERQGIKRYYS